MSMLDALKYKNMARDDPSEYYRQTPIMRAAAEQNLGGWLGQAYDQDIKPAYDAWTPQASDLYNVPKTIAQALGGSVKGNIDTMNAAAPLAMAGDDDAMAQAAKASFDLASMYGGSTAAASLAGGVPRGAVLGAHVFQGGPHKYGPEGASESLKHMSKGEGAQAYGYGRYDAESEGVANEYYKALSDTFTEAGGKRIHQTGHGGRSFGDLDARQRGLLNELESVATARKKTAKEVIDERLSYNAEMRKGYEAEIAKSEKGSFPEQLSQEHLATIDHDEQFLRKLLDEDVNFKTEGYLYKHDLPDEDIARYLDYDAPLSEQPEIVKALESIIESTSKSFPEIKNNPNVTGQGLYNAYKSHRGGSGEEASKAFGKAGIPGLKYYDGMSRGQVGGATATNIRERIAGAEASNSNLRKAIEDGDLGPGNDPHKMQLAKGEAEVRGWQKELAQHDSNATRNYVTWDQEVLDRMKLLERNNEDMTKALMQK